MDIDARQLNDQQHIDCDLCIIGAGPAGVTLAQDLIDSGLSVALLESGGNRNDARTQALSSGELSGDVYEPLQETHLRQVGGTANHWIIKMSDQQYGYRYTPLSASDFKPRDALPHSGWPISREDLDPWYARAHEVCRAGPCRYTPGSWESPDARALPLDDTKLQTHYFQFGPTDVFTRHFPERCRQSDNITLYRHATVTELITNPAGSHVETAVVKTFDGKTIHFRAQRFVIAAGGLQTPRLLLASQRHDPKGIGNQHDQVGRYFMDHSLVPSGNFYLEDPTVLERLHLYDMRLVDGASVLAGITLSEQALEAQQLHNISATLFPMPPLRDVDALESLKTVAIALKGRRLPKRLLTHSLNILKGSRYLSQMLYHKFVHHAPLLPGFGQGGWSRLKNNHKRFNRIELLAFIEQAPDPDNRVTLIEQRDELGMPMIRLHYRWNENDLQRLAKAQSLMAEELGRIGLGRFEPASEDGQPVIGSLGLHHLMGTTRMSTDPRKGVVDRNCLVHGTDNLYIASSSVFTTSGYANPTLTILALALRLGEHLRSTATATPN